MPGQLGTEEILQIDCNNSNIDSCVATRFSNNDNPLVLTAAGIGFNADASDEVPYACPLTRNPGDYERDIEDFVEVCNDCPHAFISLLPLIIDTV